MIQILYGCESYKMDLIKGTALKDVDAFNKGFFTGISKDILEFLNADTLMVGKKVAIVTLSDLAELDHPIYRILTENYKKSTENDILFCAKTADKRKKFIKELIKDPLVKECGRCTSEVELAKILRFEAKAKGYVFEPAAETLFIERTGYLIDESLNLYHIKNMILDLTELLENDVITEKSIIDNNSENILFNAFTLTSLIDQGKIGEIKRQAERLRDGNTIPAISAMLYDFRTTYKTRLGMSRTEVGIFKESPLLKYSTSQLLKCINICTGTVEKIKKGEISEKDALMYACLEITGVIKT